MSHTDPRAEFARLLRGLKQRSGRSYEYLSRKTHASRSSLHRYCSAQVVPPDVETVMRIAEACDADANEKHELAAAWLEAVRPRRRAGEPAPGQPEPPVEETDTEPSADAVAPLPPAAAPAPPPSPGGRPKRRLIAGASLVAACVVALSSYSAPLVTTPAKDRMGTPRALPGSIWTVHPRAVSPAMFGVTVNSDTGMMPTFRIGAVRLWDSGTRWASLQPRRDEFDWATLDRLVGAAERDGRDLMFVIGGTPAWAAPKAPRMAYPDGSRAAAPDDLADWDAFVRKLSDRYRDRIDAYELWVNGNDRRYFNGTPERLVDMTRRASTIIKRTAPRAQVVCPGMGRLWEPAGQQILRRFAELGGYRYCDAASIKLHQRRPTDPPETMLQPLETVDRVMHQAGVHPVLWSTGTTHDVAAHGPMEPERATDHAVRFYLTGLVGSHLYLRRMYFYNWGGTRIPIVLQGVGGPPTQAALGIERLQRWIARAKIRSCGHGPPAALPANAWQCEFELPEPDQGTATVRWTDGGRADTTAPPRSTVVEELGGATRPVRPGDTVSISERPVLIRGAPQ